MWIRKNSNGHARGLMRVFATTMRLRFCNLFVRELLVRIKRNHVLESAAQGQHVAVQKRAKPHALGAEEQDLVLDADAAVEQATPRRATPGRMFSPRILRGKVWRKCRSATARGLFSRQGHVDRSGRRRPVVLWRVRLRNISSGHIRKC